MTASLTNSPADILKFQNDCVRTGQVEPLGRMQKISIGPNASWSPKTQDATMQKFGRFIELRDQPLPIAQSLDKSMLLVCAPLLHKVSGRVELPDLPDPNWAPGQATKEEVEGMEVVRHGVTVRAFPNDKDWPGGPVTSNRVAPMVKQDLVARAEGFLEGTNFLIFSPVLRVTFQPEINKRMTADAWIIECKHDPATRTDMALLVDRATGEVHFFGGRFEILGSSASPR